jgi:hypothetical protein
MESTMESISMMESPGIWTGYDRNFISTLSQIRYATCSGISSRVGYFNPRWNEECNSEIEMV